MRIWALFAAISVCLTAGTGPAMVQARSRRAGESAGATKTGGGSQVGVPSGGTTSAAKLPLRRIVLYKDGVGYFEHLGQVSGDQTVSIDFTTAQLNDVLNSLTLLDLGGGRITSVDYNSQASLERRFNDLRLPVGINPTEANFLGALGGARLEVSNRGTTYAGRLLSVERVLQRRGNALTPVEQISLVSDTGEVRTAILGPATSIRILGRRLRSEVGRYLALRASARQRDVRRMEISTAGTGERQLYVSYISEVPIWKATYRIVLPTKAGAKPLLEGWAIVDNTVGEDWKNVRLSLVSGAPESFIQDLSQPYYGRRPVVPLPEGVELTPQTHEPALKSRVSQGVLVYPTGAGYPSGLQAGVAGGVGGGTLGGGNAAEPAAPPLGGRRAGNLLNQARLAEAAQAEGRALGSLYEYNVEKRVTIRKNQSALVPILNTPVEAQKVSLWNRSLGSSHPLRAIWMTNSSPYTLAGGSFSLLEGETFAGEGLLNSIRPGGKRLLSYAVDLGMDVNGAWSVEPERVTEVRISHGVMTQTVMNRQTVTYTIRNDDGSPRTLVLEYPRQPGWMLDSAEEPVETTARNYRFELEVRPRQTVALKVSEHKPMETSYTLTNLSSSQVEFFLGQRTLNSQVEQALEGILAEKRDVAADTTEIQTRRKEIADIFQDQQRIRKNLTALRGQPEGKALADRYTRRLNDQETQLGALRKELSALEAKRQVAQQQLDRAIERLNISEKM